MLQHGQGLQVFKDCIIELGVKTFYILKTSQNIQVNLNELALGCPNENHWKTWLMNGTSIHRNEYPMTSMHIMMTRLAVLSVGNRKQMSRETRESEAKGTLKQRRQKRFEEEYLWKFE